MGSCLGKDYGGSSQEKKTAAKIDKELRNEKNKQYQNIKLLLLGAGESGKTTFAKQLKILYLNGYTKQELSSYKDIIHSNTVMGIRTLILEAEKRNMPLPDALHEDVELLISEDILLDQLVDKEIGAAVEKVWKDPTIQKVYDLRHEFQICESVAYYMENIDRIGEESYIPSVDDVLQARARTIGIKEITFSSKGYDWRVVDVGGQRTERKKWIHCFEDVKAIIFFVDASAYNMNLFEDERVNRLLESFTLFEEICNCKYFDSTPLILFLNKSDLLKQKIVEVDIKDYFEDYNGGKDFDNAVTWMKKKFSALSRDVDKAIYIHVTCATNTDNIKFVFTAVEEIILYETLAQNDLV